MGKEIISGTVKVATIGKTEEYINLPVVKDGKSIGVVTNCVQEGYQYKLTVSLWQDIGLELLNGEPMAVTFS